MIGWHPPFIFVHIPKCAGSSVERALTPLVTGGRPYRNLNKIERDKYWLPGQSRLQHAKLKDYAQHFPLQDYYRFALVRNPWDRAVSQVRFIEQKKPGGFDRRHF